MIALTSPQSSTAHAPSWSGLRRREFVARWYLVILAVLTWLLTSAALLLDHLTAVPHPLVIGLYGAVFLAGGTLACRDAIADLRHGVVNVDLLMVLAAVGAAAIGAWAEGAILLGLFSTSNALEHHALDRTRNAVRALMELSPDTATRVDAGTGRVETVAVSALHAGDVILVRPGEKVPADATITSGQTDVDQSAITGESLPVVRGPQDTLFAGTLNGSGAVYAEVDRTGENSTLAQIVRMVEEAQSRKSRAERFTDAFEGPYAIGVIASAVLFAGGTWLWGVPASDALYRAMTLLVVASPCALVISTPAATLSAIAAAARRGVLVKGGASLDAVGVIDTVAFDKTGTLTTGRPKVTGVVSARGMTETDVLVLAASLEQFSEHVLGEAIVDAGRQRNLDLPGVDDFVTEPGLGLRGNVGDRTVLVGNEAHAQRHGVVIGGEMAAVLGRRHELGETAMVVARDGEAIGVISVADTVRPEAAGAVNRLRELGVRRIVMVTGDHHEVADTVARQVGIPEVYANLLPQEKLALVESFREDGTVAMVGDGVNDAPALAAGDIGIAMGGRGTDVALETADIVLMADDLHKLPFAIGLSRSMRRVIRFNIGFSLLVIAALVLSTLAVGIPLPLGVVGHEGSTIVVVLAGLRLLAFRDLRHDGGRVSWDDTRPRTTVMPLRQRFAGLIGSRSMRIGKRHGRPGFRGGP